MRMTTLSNGSRRRSAALYGLLHAWAGAALAVVSLSAAAPAAAQDCQTDADCGVGRVCHTEQYESCTGECKPDMMCPPESCETLERKYCVSAPCSTDADCPQSMVCHAPTYTECSGGGMTGCDPGASGCPAPEPADGGSECHEVTGDPTCTPRYQLPCTADADCGAGFACEEQFVTVCSGGGMGGRPAGDALDGGSADCHTESTGFACRLLELACEADTDCADGLECQNNPSYPSCGAADAGSATGGGTAGATVMAAALTDCGAGSTPPKVCAPHGYFDGMNPPPGGTDGGVDNGGGETKDAGAGGEGGGGSSGGTTDAGSGSGEGNGSGGQGGGHHHHGGHFPYFGCSVSAADASSQIASVFGLVSLVAVGLRRRARLHRT